MAHDSADHDKLYRTGRGAYTLGPDVDPVTDLLHSWRNSVAELVAGSLRRTDPRHLGCVLRPEQFDRGRWRSEGQWSPRARYHRRVTALPTSRGIAEASAGLPRLRNIRSWCGSARELDATMARANEFRPPPASRGETPLSAVVGNSGEIMQLSSRRFLIAQEGVLYRLADATFTRMLQNPHEHALAILAGQRVRMASLIVELIGGKPAHVVRSTFATLIFDKDGHMDLGAFTRQQWALAESALDSALDRTKHEEKVLHAAARFIAQGGRWRPSNSWARAINEAALGHVRCRRL
jgi:hypothetical protein